MKLSKKNKSGIILYAVLWTMVILSMLVVGIGWQTHIELTLAKHFTGKIQSKYIAVSGLNYTLNIIQKYKENKDLKKPDILHSLATHKKISFGSGSFQIMALQDEESRINLNALNQSNYLIFVNLLSRLGVDEETALTIASSIIDWIDIDHEISLPPHGAEDDYYLSLGYNCKNQPFDSIEEILLLKGMNKNIFQKLKDLITIYPSNGSLLINIDSAPDIILRAFAQNFIGAQTNTTAEDADSLVDKIIEYRKSQTSPTLTTEERAVEINKISLNAKEKTIFLMMQSLRQRDPQFIHIHILGLDASTQASTDLMATVSMSDLSIQRWQRN